EVARWVAVRPNCRAFASFDWRAPLHGPREHLAVLPAPAAPATTVTALAAPSIAAAESAAPSAPPAPLLTAPKPGR
ncbi:MAG TPA: hypothetical protein VJN67_00105, partial [Stellaceae bacterium]|nr:hypothetical protein [Stellaceae bacterium]